MGEKSEEALMAQASAQWLTPLGQSLSLPFPLPTWHAMNAAVNPHLCASFLCVPFLAVSSAW